MALMPSWHGGVGGLAFAVNGVHDGAFGGKDGLVFAVALCGLGNDDAVDRIQIAAFQQIQGALHAHFFADSADKPHFPGEIRAFIGEIQKHDEGRRHAVGTSYAIKLGEVEGAMSGLTIGLHAIIASMVMPLLINLLGL